MYPPKKKKKLSLAVQTKLIMCRVSPRLCLSGDEMGNVEVGEDQRRQNPFYTMQRINPLSSTMSITSMLCCIYRLILLL
ncbi:unnamed protein product [Staurois parvus]|uniref:Uncharacterized protein n=1 Tax=Staurois parvus TaxID=386267 RepID=A0ABN9EQI4_9NEOB|nr:unnamed protein product [Staurois parvus]